jgi:hypothetical protein
MIGSIGEHDEFGEGWLPNLAATEVPKAIAADSLHGLAYFLPITRNVKEKVDLTVFLSEVWGDKWNLNQGSCGSCVAFGAALACDALMAIDIVTNGKPKPAGRTDPMTIYWGSRVEIGGGQIWGEGSVGVWACKYLKEYGALEQKPYPNVDLSRYSEAVCCGPNARKGVPDHLEPIARNYPVKVYAQATNFDQAVAALDAGYPVTVASNQGFSRRLDANGFATASGTWNHQMCVIGYELSPTPCLYIANSWGAYYSGGPSEWCPAVKKVHKRTCDRMLSQGDSWSLSDFVGFHPKGLDFSKLKW